jgi:hypothetical protein
LVKELTGNKVGSGTEIKLQLEGAADAVASVFETMT